CYADLRIPFRPSDAPLRASSLSRLASRCNGKLVPFLLSRIVYAWPLFLDGCAGTCLYVSGRREMMKCTSGRDRGEYSAVRKWAGNSFHSRFLTSAGSKIYV